MPLTKEDALLVIEFYKKKKELIKKREEEEKLMKKIRKPRVRTIKNTKKEIKIEKIKLKRCVNLNPDKHRHQKKGRYIPKGW